MTTPLWSFRLRKKPFVAAAAFVTVTVTVVCWAAVCIANCCRMREAVVPNRGQRHFEAERRERVR